MTHHEPEREGFTGYAIVKYGIILLIVIAVLWFLAVYVLPLITERDEGGERQIRTPDEQYLSQAFR
ncbi:MAG TPA: hypothetical protein VE754_00440 [Actinomycetota bacterium]|jgi:hypothetical protein|nr:hypothetical protein [Actinomycetota bacterium]